MIQEGTLASGAVNVTSFSALRQSQGELLEAQRRGCVAAIGNFDGMHLGHREILKSALKVAGSCEPPLPLVVCTFHPHPRTVLDPSRPVPLLMTREEKAERIGQYSPALLVDQEFDLEFSGISAEQFYSKYLVNLLNAKAIVVGRDFCFGKGRKGDPDLLGQWTQRDGLSLHVVDPVLAEGGYGCGTVAPQSSGVSSASRVGPESRISSSIIRDHLLHGRVREASCLLGYPFFYRGRVMRGEERGRRLGFPTANLPVPNKLVLPYGVYATRTRLLSEPDGGSTWQSVTNMGIRPTISSGGQAVVETYLIGYSGDLYGVDLEIQFIERLRDERRFGSLEDLRAQIARDVEEAKKILRV